MARSIALQKKLAETRKEKDEQMAEGIRKVAIAKVNSMSDGQIDIRVNGLGEAKFSTEASVKMILGDFASFIKNVEHFQNDEYEDVKKVAIDAVLPIFGKKILETKAKDMSKLNIAEKSQILIDNINKMSFNLCKDNAERANREYNTPGSVRMANENNTLRDLMYDGAIEVDGNDDSYPHGSLENENSRSYVDFNGDNQEENLKHKTNAISLEDLRKFMDNGGKPGEPVIVKNDFVFSGKKKCVIRFADKKFDSNKSMKINEPVLRAPEKYKEVSQTYHNAHGGYNKRWILSSEKLNGEEILALNNSCFRKNNRQYTLDRVTLQNIINGKLKKTAPIAMKIVSFRNKHFR